MNQSRSLLPVPRLSRNSCPLKAFNDISLKASPWSPCTPISPAHRRSLPPYVSLGSFFLSFWNLIRQNAATDRSSTPSSTPIRVPATRPSDESRETGPSGLEEFLPHLQTSSYNLPQAKPLARPSISYQSQRGSARRRHCPSGCWPHICRCQRRSGRDW